MKLPKDSSNWTARHAELAIKRRNELFSDYEKVFEVDNDNNLTPKANDAYRSYLIAEDVAKTVCSVTHYPYKSLL